MHCRACGSEVAQGSRFCPACAAPVSEVHETRTSLPSRHDDSAPPRSLDSLDDSRFLPGTVLAGRYRVVGLIGRGGMGEVYRADDVKLGQTVALKFLPAGLERDAARLARFFSEVRMARQVTHPNVCRVYDAGEYEGQHYLSMEYVDGEDLSSLLRRIGRLPHEKAVQIARQLCAGVAAAHDQGILHRDLKPANVMIDGRGRVRITDFGLAGLADEFRGAEIRAGTPTYMAPEQFEGRQVSTRSDIYSLGLVLYELFTGKPAYAARTQDELRQMHESTPTTPSSLVDGFDPTVERVILRCLERDPQLRPASALSVAAALPGGDPLAEALAAGETPSPEMVAAAGGEGGVAPRIALASLAFILLGVAGATLLDYHRSLLRHVELDKPPEALTVVAREILADVGHDAPRVDSAIGFAVDADFLGPLEARDGRRAQGDEVAAARPSPLRFWYRQSPTHLVPVDLGPGNITPDLPPQDVSGMAGLQLDSAGRLVALTIVPPQRDDSVGPSPDPDWAPLFARAGLEPGSFEPARSEWNPPFDCDGRAAWLGHYPDRPDLPIRVEAGSYRGRPVYFQVVTPWAKAGRMESEPKSVGENLAAGILVVLLFALLAGGLLLARRNVRLGRGDRRGAFRIASFLFLLFLAMWIVDGDHVPRFAEVGLLIQAVAWSLFFAGAVWVCYVALEPHVRKLWPTMIIAWTRLIAGRFRDPLVGRAILAGGVIYVALNVLAYLRGLLESWSGVTPPAPAWNDVQLAVLEGTRQAAAVLLQSLWAAAWTPIGFLFLLLLLRVVLRRQWLAVGAFVVIFSLPAALQAERALALTLLFNLLVLGTFAFLLLRFGLLAFVVFFVFNGVDNFPAVIDPSLWFAGRTLIAKLALAALACYGFWIALAGRSLFARDLLPDHVEALR